MENKNAHLDELCINTMRFLAVDAVEKAKSGHPGMPMGDAKMAYVLWKKFLRHNPKNPLWPARDRFVLSAGHGSMLLYSLLHLTGYDEITLDEIKNFRQWGSKTPGHPEYHLKHGIETTTGPLGQGMANAVGMAMAQKYLADRYNKPGHHLFDYFIYAICGDGDMMEGVTNEAASLAGHLGLGSLIVMYSDNKITIEGSTDITFTEDVGKRFEALKWHVVKADGHDAESISKAITAGRDEKHRPTLIIVRTNIGFGSPAKQDSHEAHGAPLGSDEVKASKKKLGFAESPEFHIPDEVMKHMRAAVEKGDFMEKEWKTMLSHYEKQFQDLAVEIKSLLSGNIDTGWEAELPKYAATDAPVATRSVSGKVLNAIAKKTPFLIGGSADLAPSNNTFLKDMPTFDTGKSGRNVHYGVREHAMGSVMNGIAQCGFLIPYGGTFLVFSDYMRPAIRMAALSGHHVVYVFTHDSIGLGEDGPTHQPVEHLSSLRAIPNLVVLRPADAVETVEAWKAALKRKTGPTALSLTRQNLPVLDRAKYGKSTGEETSRGAYVLADKSGVPDVILIATGSEVELAVAAFDKLIAKGVKARVVSMPSTELFEEQDEKYKNEVIPPQVRARVVIEAGTTHGWHKYSTGHGVVIGIDKFGASAPYKTLYENYGLTVANIEAIATKLVGK